MICRSFAGEFNKISIQYTLYQTYTFSFIYQCHSSTDFISTRVVKTILRRLVSETRKIHAPQMYKSDLDILTYLNF